MLLRRSFTNGFIPTLRLAGNRREGSMGGDSARADSSGSRSPEEAREWVEKGDALKGEMRFEEALKCYECALELDPVNPRYWFARGKVLSAATRNQEALACFEKALAIDPKYLMAWAGKARELRGLGKTNEAAVCLKRYRNLVDKEK